MGGRCTKEETGGYYEGRRIDENAPMKHWGLATPSPEAVGAIIQDALEDDLEHISVMMRTGSSTGEAIEVEVSPHDDVVAAAEAATGLENVQVTIGGERIVGTFEVVLRASQHTANM